MARMWPGLWVPLEGRLVTLEPLRREHKEGLRAAAGDERIWRFMITIDPEEWLRATFAEAQSGQSGSSPFRTSSSKCDSHSMQTYS